MMNFELRAVSPEKYDQFLAAKKAGKTTPEALAAIGAGAVRDDHRRRSTPSATRSRRATLARELGRA